MSHYYTEEHYENAVLELFNKELAYTSVHGFDIERDYNNPLFESVIEECLVRININIPYEVIKDVFYNH